MFPEFVGGCHLHMPSILFSWLNMKHIVWVPRIFGRTSKVMWMWTPGALLPYKRCSPARTKMSSRSMRHDNKGNANIFHVISVYVVLTFSGHGSGVDLFVTINFLAPYTTF